MILVENFITMITASVLLIMFNMPMENSVLGKKITNSNGDLNLSYRLSGSVIPTLYSLFFHIDPNEPGFIGNASIQVNITKATNRIIVHADKSLQITSTNIYNADRTKDFTISTQHRHNEFMFYVTDLSECLSPGEYILEYAFKRPYSTDYMGIYNVSYTSKGIEEVLAVSQFEAMGARAAFPCFDEPALKANFTVKILHPRDFEAISNMPIKESTLNGSNMLSAFDTTVKMSTYLLVVAVSKYKFIQEVTESGTEMKFYAEEEQLEHYHYVLEDAKNAMNYLDNYFQINYVLPKLDWFKMPHLLANGMENWGLVTLNAKILPHKRIPQTSIIVCHEAAHMWFGNLVTMMWWDELWLNEAFATFMASKCADDALTGNIKATVNRVGYQMNNAYLFDATILSRPIVASVGYKMSLGSFDHRIHYNKGSMMVSMLENLAGAKVFQTALKNYMNRFAYKNAKSTDLYEEVENALDEESINVPQIMDTWIKQKGFPVVSVSRVECSSTKLNLSQNRFLNYPSAAQKDNYNQPFGGIWYIPINYKTSSKNNGSFMLTEKSQEIESSGFTDQNWILFNVERQGFFHVHYEKSLLSSITEALHQNYLDFFELERIALVFESFELAAAGFYSYSETFKLCEYLTNEKESDLVLTTFFDSMQRILPLMNDSKLKAKLLEKMQKTFSAIDVKQIITSKSSSNRKIDTALLQISCVLEDERCLNATRDLFLDLLFKNTALPEGLEEVILQFGILRNAKNDTVWKTLLSKLPQFNENVKEFANKYLVIVDDKQKLKTIASQVMKKMLDKSTLRVTELIVLNNKDGVDVLLDIFKENINSNEKWVEASEGVLEQHFYALASTLYTKQDAKKLRSFASKFGRKVKNLRKIVNDVINGLVNKNIWWRQNCLKTIQDYVSE